MATFVSATSSGGMRVSSVPATRTTRSSCSSITDTSAVASLPEQRMTRLPCAVQLVDHRGEVLAVDVEDARVGGREDLRLGLGDRRLVLHPLEVDGADGGDRRDRRLHPLAQLGDLARSVGAHLGDEHLGARGEVLVDGAGEAGRVVEAGRRRQHRAARLDEVGDVPLRRRLAVAAGDGDDGGVRCSAASSWRRRRTAARCGPRWAW